MYVRLDEEELYIFTTACIESSELLNWKSEGPYLLYSTLGVTKAEE